MLEILEIIKKHGALGMTVIALIWMNSRLSSVEERLFQCLNDKQEIKQASTHRGEIYIKENLVAVLPNERKNKRVIS
jgi:hypothetical protein